MMAVPFEVAMMAGSIAALLKAGVAAVCGYSPAVVQTGCCSLRAVVVGPHTMWMAGVVQAMVGAVGNCLAVPGQTLGLHSRAAHYQQH